MEDRDTPYRFRDELAAKPTHDPEEREVVIVDGQAMTYRSYRR